MHPQATVQQSFPKWYQGLLQPGPQGDAKESQKHTETQVLINTSHLLGPVHKFCRSADGCVQDAFLMEEFHPF